MGEKQTSPCKVISTATTWEFDIALPADRGVYQPATPPLRLRSTIDAEDATGSLAFAPHQVRCATVSSHNPDLEFAMSCQKSFAKPLALLAAYLFAISPAMAEEGRQSGSSIIADHRDAIINEIVTLAGGGDADITSSKFVEALDGKVRSRSAQLGQVTYPSTPGPGQLTVSSVVPPLSKSASADIAVCVEQGDRVLGTFSITPAGQLAGRTSAHTQANVEPGGLMCMPWIRARAKSILISP